MKLRTVALVAIALAAVVSCNPDRKRPAAIPLVREILENKNDRYHKLIAATSHPNPQGEIVIIGSERAVSMLSETLAKVDVRDNIDGSFKSDGLPDFAGETIACIIDTTGRPEELMFAPNAEENNSADFRRFLLNGFLNAVDTIYHVTPYDQEGVGRKIPAKLIISADPVLTMLTRHDVDTLFSTLGSKVHIVAPSDELNEAMLSARVNRDVVVAVMHDPMFKSSDIYARRFMRYASKNGSFGSSVSSFPTPRGAENLFTAFLDEYAEAGFTRPLNAMAIADFGVNLDSLKTEYAWTLSMLNEESAKYSQYLAKDFRFISSLETTVGRCYDILRAENLFTHKIANPLIITYYCYPDPQDNFVSYLVPAPYVQN